MANPFSIGNFTTYDEMFNPDAISGKLPSSWKAPTQVGAAGTNQNVLPTNVSPNALTGGDPTKVNPYPNTYPNQPPVAVTPTPQQGIVNDMMSGQAFDPYRQQAQEAQARFERNTRASGAAVANQRGFAGQGIGDQMANTTEAGLARQRFDTAVQLDIGEQATKERGAGIAMDQAWKTLDWAAVNGSDADFVQAYEKATGQRIDPMAVSQYRGYARTLAEQQIASNAANLETGETDKLTGYITAAKGSNANWDWKGDDAAVRSLGDEYTRRTGKAFSMSDPTAVAWADQFVGMTSTDPITSTINSMTAAPWFKNLDPTSQQQLVGAVTSAGMASTSGMTFEFDDKGQIVASRYPDGGLAWSREGYKTPEQKTGETFQTDYTAYRTANPTAPEFDQETYDAVEEDLGHAPTEQEYAQAAPNVAGNVEFNGFSEQYSAKYGAAVAPDREVYDTIKTTLGKTPTVDDYKKYEKYMDTSTLNQSDITDISKDPTAYKIVKEQAAKLGVKQASVEGSDLHGIVKFSSPPAKGTAFEYAGDLYFRTGGIEENYRTGRNTQYFSSIRILPNGKTEKVWITTTGNGALQQTNVKPE